MNCNGQVKILCKVLSKRNVESSDVHKEHHSVCDSACDLTDQDRLGCFCLCKKQDSEAARVSVEKASFIYSTDFLEEALEKNLRRKE